MAYLSELTDLRIELEAIEQQLDRFEYALLALERAAGTDIGDLDRQDPSNLRLTADVSRFGEALRKATALMETLVRVADQLDAALAPRSFLSAQEMSTPEARRTVDDVTVGMDRLIDAWKTVRDRIGVDLLRIEGAAAGGRPRWGEHWPVDADLARDLSREDFGLKERDSMMLAFYYEQGLTQSQIADALGVSQATVAGRMSALETVLSAEIAVRRFAQRFPVDEGRTLSAQFRRDAPIRLVVLTREGDGRRVLLIPSDRLERRASLNADLKRAVGISGVALYDIATGRFRFRERPDLIQLAEEHPYRLLEDVEAAFPISEEEWQR